MFYFKYFCLLFVVIRTKKLKQASVRFLNIYCSKKKKTKYEPLNNKQFILIGN